MTPITSTVDITPTPRILRTLGEIPFLPWQCLAELIDNSIDAFLAREASAEGNDEQKITVAWSNDSVGSKDRTVEIVDNAHGMTLDQIQNAVRAGYSSNDPINNLGLFGMGFNISTARLGEVTTVLSTRKGDAKWVGLTVDFEQMIKTKRFDAPIEKRQKNNKNESGTKIIVSRLRQGIRDELAQRENDIRRQLESIYTPLLNTKDISIFVKGKQLFPRNHCVWSSSRYVMYNQQSVSAYIEIDRDLGHSLFDLDRNCYLTPDEAEPYYLAMPKGESLPPRILERSKRLSGWLGIQRYADPNDFGIDFIRNGRKILILDKSFFQYENPYTGQKELQYPMELGTSVGGRIVGELHVDYLLPTYQKNGFDKTDTSWHQTVEAICGTGPFLPKMRKNLGFTEPLTAPLAILINAYRRIDQGTKCLFAPNDLSKRYAVQFRAGKRDFLNDDLWWKAAQEEDQKRSSGGTRATTAVNTGTTASDDLDSYLGQNKTTTVHPAGAYSEATPVVPQPQTNVPVTQTSHLDELIQKSNNVVQLTGKYSFGNMTALNIRAYELKEGHIYADGSKKPAFFFSEGIDCSFVYDPNHPLLTQFPITPKILLLQYLSEKLKARDGLGDVVDVFSTLVQTSMVETKIDKQSLQDRGITVFSLLREKLFEALKSQTRSVLNCIHESSGEVEDTINNMLSNSSLIKAFQESTDSGYDAISYVPDKTLLRLVDRFPEEVFDGKVVAAPYLTINFADTKATERSRNESKDRIMSFLKDALRITTNTMLGQGNQKNELSRASLSIDFLLGELS